MSANLFDVLLAHSLHDGLDALLGVGATHHQLGVLLVSFVLPPTVQAVPGTQRFRVKRSIR